tara:strand:- start:2443 stop:2769 length:327 start_codon:yes stop_codon:yes gene_type:complete
MPPFKNVTVYDGTYVNIKKRINEDDYWIRLFGRINYLGLHSNEYFNVKYVETLEVVIKNLLRGIFLTEALYELHTIKQNKLIPKQYSRYELFQKIKFFGNKENNKFPK